MDVSIVFRELIHLRSMVQFEMYHVSVSSNKLGTMCTPSRQKEGSPVPGEGELAIYRRTPPFVVFMNRSNGPHHEGESYKVRRAIRGGRFRPEGTTSIPEEGFEPSPSRFKAARPTFGLLGGLQGRIVLFDAAGLVQGGFEPPPSGLQADALPLSYRTDAVGGIRTLSCQA